jgi:hypothetical protein
LAILSQFINASKIVLQQVHSAEPLLKTPLGWRNTSLIKRFPDYRGRIEVEIANLGLTFGVLLVEVCAKGGSTVLLNPPVLF